MTTQTTTNNTITCRPNAAETTTKPPQMARKQRSALGTVLLALLVSVLLAISSVQPADGRIILVQTGSDAPNNELASSDVEADLQQQTEQIAADEAASDAESAMSPIFLAWLNAANDDTTDNSATPSAPRLLRRSVRRTKPRRKSHRKRSDRTASDDHQAPARWYRNMIRMMDDLVRPAGAKRGNGGGGGGTSSPGHSSNGGGSHDKRPQFVPQLCHFKICNMG